jgi:hypothetical protein
MQLENIVACLYNDNDFYLLDSDLLSLRTTDCERPNHLFSI